MSERSIIRRRQQEDSRSALLSSLKVNKALDANAHWINKADNVRAKTFVGQELIKWRKQRAAKLAERQARLRVLLAEDEARYRVEIDNAAESSEERRNRLKARAQKLKQEREDRRKEFAEKMRVQQFRNTCDELRSNAGKNLLMECSRTRAQQIEEKRLNDSLTKSEDTHWMKIWNEEYTQKIEREVREAQAKKDLNRQTFSVIGKQIEERELAKELEAKRKAEQAQRRVEQLSSQTAQALTQQEAKHAAVKLRRAEIELETKAARERLQQLKLAEAQADKDFIATVLAREAAEKKKASGSAEAQQKDAASYLAYLADHKAREAQREKELEERRQVDLEKAFAKRQLKWEQEKLARENLLKQVYQIRQDQIAYKASQKTLKAAQDAQASANSISLGDPEANGNQPRLSKKAVADFLRKQIHEAEQRGTSRADKLAEARRAQAAEAEFQQKLQLEKEKDMADMATGRTVSHHPKKTANWWTH